PIIELARLMDSRTTSSTAFDNSVFSMMDVEEVLRVLAIVTNIDHWDTWGGRRGKNCYFYRAPSDGLWRLIPWALELTFGNAGGGEFSTMPSNPSGTIPNHFSEVTRLLNRPRVKRMYYGILKGMIDNFFYTGGSSPLSAYMSQVSSAGVGSTGGISSFVNSRNNYLRSRVDAACYPAVRLGSRPTAAATLPMREPRPSSISMGNHRPMFSRSRFRGMVSSSKTWASISPTEIFATGALTIFP
ncbi:MAG: CotH kinase family protein, partial [Planctomycetes bacterium]|nr:CotH kinase family protein [Planctomycetota bacterium]